MLFIRKNSVRITILFSFLFSVWLSGNLGAFDQQNIKYDVIFYHSYTPALFVKKDLKLSFYKDSAAYYCDRNMYWAAFQENGNPIIKATCGQSIMYLPFTLWVYLYYSGEPITGYEVPFSAAICISTLIYFLLSLLLLKKILERLSYSQVAISLAILLVTFGTNFLSYVTNYWGTAHSSDFFLLTCLMYLLPLWFQKPSLKTSILSGLCLGLLILIRPTNILFALLIMLYGVRNYRDLRSNLRFLSKHIFYLLVMGLCLFIVFVPQLLYWKYVTGHWIYFSYVGERFFFDKPHLQEYLIGFRKGWLIYTPLILLAMAGLFIKHQPENKFLFATVLIVLAYVYINSCWWCWWFGGSFGARSMIETYPLLVFGFCNFGEWLQKKKKSRLIAYPLLLFFVLHNVKSSYLNRVNKIHYDGMTWQAYRYLFFKITVDDEEYEYLKTLYKSPDYEKAKKGIDT